MNDKYNVYRAYAAFCERMARESEGEDRKQSWLRLAADWLALIRDSSSTDSQSDSTKNDTSRTEVADGQHVSVMADEPHDDQPRDDPSGAAKPPPEH